MLSGSSGGLEILANDPRMTSRNSQQGEGRTIRIPAALLPVPKRVNSDRHRLSKLRLGQPDKAPEGRNVFAGFDLSKHEPSAYARRHRSGQIFFRQFRDFTHALFLNGANLKLGQFSPEQPRQVLVEQDPFHAILATSAGLASSRNAKTCSRLTPG